jgi:hypothetical protein
VEKPLVEQANEFLARARFRAQRRKSPWNLILIPLVFGGWLGTWYLVFRLVWTYHVWLYPDHHFRNFWHKGISFPSFALSFLMLFAPMPGALSLGFIAGNLVSWLIKPARKTFEAESVGYPGTSFRESNAGLLKLAMRTFPIGVAVSLLAASFLKSLR